MTGPEDEPDGAATADDETPNAATPAGVAAQAKRSRKQHDRHGDFWGGVLDTPIGREVVWGLLQSAHTFDTRFAAGPSGFPDVHATWFHAGEQAFGQALYQRLLVIDMPNLKRMHDEHDPRFKAVTLPRPAQPGEA